MFILFVILWIIFNGKITLEIILFGIIIAACMFAFICKFMDYSIQKDIKRLKKVFFILQYIIILVVEIIRANMHVIKLILSPEYEIEPEVITFTTDLKSDVARVVLANSITLTPGTITAMLEKDCLTVHCLDKEFAKGIENSVFVTMLKRMEG